MAIILSNGNMVPNLPNYDTKQYPYAVINAAIGSYGLYLSKEPITVKTLTYFYNEQALIVPAGYMRWICYINGVDWEYIETEVDEGHLVPIGIGWSNHDIINEDDGTVFFAASDPVPVGGEAALTERDLYKKINGQPTKLTLYKKVGGELLPLDEYTQGGNL